MQRKRRSHCPVRDGTPGGATAGRHPESESGGVRIGRSRRLTDDQAGALVDEEGAALLAQNLKYTVDVEQGQLGHRQKVGARRLIERPTVDRQIEGEIERRLLAPVAELNPAAAIRLRELTTAAQLGELRNLGGGKVLRALAMLYPLPA